MSLFVLFMAALICCQLINAQEMRASGSLLELWFDAFIKKSLLYEL